MCCVWVSLWYFFYGRWSGCTIIVLHMGWMATHLHFGNVSILHLFDALNSLMAFRDFCFHQSHVVSAWGNQYLQF